MLLHRRLTPNDVVADAFKLLILCAFCLITGGCKTAEPQVSDIGALIARIKSEPDGRARYELGSKLADVVGRNSSSEGIDAATIDNIASLLDEPDDSVRFWSALALGQLGPKARRTVPALENALREAWEKERKIYGPKSGIRLEDVLVHVLWRVGTTKEIGP